MRDWAEVEGPSMTKANANPEGEITRRGANLRRCVRQTNSRAFRLRAINIRAHVIGGVFAIVRIHNMATFVDEDVNRYGGEFCD